MATERALALAAILGVSCSPIADRCRSGTLLVTVTLAGANAAADALVIDVALDGGAPHESTIAHTPGHAGGNVVVQFPSGYPRGHHVDITLTSSAGGVVLGSASAGATLSDACAVATLTLEDNGAAADLAVAGDLGAADLAAADLTTTVHDLRAPNDLTGACVPTGVESCFNGIDDDCNGHIDCDDPACAPIAVCVPTTGAPFAYVTQEPPGGSCAADTTNGGTVYVSNPSGGGCNAGSCRCDTHGCTATVTRDDNCPSGTGTTLVGTVTDVCTNSLSGQNNLFIAPPTGTISCATAGSATPVTPPTLTATLDCNVNAVGGGCTAGHVCAPMGTKQCVWAAGVQACPNGYPTGSTWYASYTDNRVCSCSCTPSSCASAGLRGYVQNDCSDIGHAQSNDICSNDYQFTKVFGGCAPTASLGATTIQFNGARTVCCE